VKALVDTAHSEARAVVFSGCQCPVFRVYLAAGAAKELQLHPVAVEEVGADDKQAAELPHLHSPHTLGVWCTVHTICISYSPATHM
jgi:hypothetical protein